MEAINHLITEQPMIVFAFVAMTFVVLAIIATSVTLLSVVKAILDNELRKKGLEPKPLIDLSGLWKRFDRSITNAVPIEREAEVALDHDYDGIKELDNHLPPWWLGMLYASIIFAVVYMLRYHVMELAPLQEEELKIELAEAAIAVEEYKKLAAASVDENSIEMITDAGELAAGGSLFEANCAACHGSAGEGGVGPNLTDNYWLHGGSIKDVFRTIKYGVPEKGMVPWQQSLKPAEIAQVSSFVMTLQGTKPANPKDPQGDLYEPNIAEEESDSQELALQN